MAKIRKVLDETEVLIHSMDCLAARKKVEEIVKTHADDIELTLVLSEIAATLYSLEQFIGNKCMPERNKQSV